MNTLKTIALALTTASLLSSCGYNSIIEKDERAKGAWAQVENAYQRRSDLIPNLVNTVKGAAEFEKSTLQAVVEARAKATSITIDPSKATEEDYKRFEEAQDGIKGALSKLMMVTENYPQLRANENFKELQSQLEGTENRIAVERNSFNTATEDYNSYLRKFPTNLTASMFSFAPKAYFKATAGSEKAPEVKF